MIHSSDHKRNVPRFLDFLEAEKHIEQSKIQRIKNAIQTSPHALDVITAELGLIDEDSLLEFYCSYFECKQYNSSNIVDVDCAKEIGFPYLSSKSVVPIQTSDDTLKLVMADPFDNEIVSTVEYFFERKVKVSIASRKQITDLLGSIEVSLHSEEVELFPDDVEDINELDMERLQDIAREAPVIKLANQVIQDGVDQSATDIHIEPWEDIIRIRFRIDGVLKDYENISKSMQAGLSTRIKILSGMNISERRLPQDGRIRTSIRGQETDFRVSSVPSIHGETIVIRILQRSSELLKLENLGFAESASKTIERITTIPNGITLVTGPTGSGKTTTLYSILRKLNDGKSKIFTVEDPVEYRLEGITQLQIDAAIGLDFADTLRSVLRQDPDTILIGEIRDLETARIAIQAALTGHRVLATLHTNSAVGAITRLRDMGIDSFLLSATLRGILGQRLVRKTCVICKDGAKRDCENCSGTGYSGRTVTYEIFELGSGATKAVGSGSSEDEIEVLAEKSGMVSLINHANTLVRNNITSEAEILRVTRFELQDG